MGRDEGTYPELSMMRWIHAESKERPDKPLLETPEDCYTYSEVERRVLSFARHLDESLGLKSGSSIVLSAPNVVQVLVALAAAQLLDIRVALMPTTVGTLEFERGIELVKPQLVISSEEEQREAARRIVPDAVIMPVEGIDVGDSDAGETATRVSDGGLQFPNANADAPIIVFTSGSTGTPKAVVNRASSFALNGIALGKWLELTDDDVIYLPVPLIHVFGLVGTYATLVAQATFVTSPRYSAEQACELIQATRATVHLGVPTNFIRELKCNEDGKWDLGSLRAGLVAGADCPPSVLERFEELYGCRIMQSYGMSETAATLTVTPLDYDVDERVATVGFCIDGADAKVDPATGEIMCKSASMMEGLLQDDGSVVLDLDDGWFRTGDVGRIDERGLVSVVGRLKNAIVRGGINIFPSEIESIYEPCDDVAECCVTSYDDAELGQRICLAVVLRPGSTATEEGLREYAKGRIDKCKVPDMVLIVDSLPYLDNGKIDRGSFAQQAQLKSKP